MSLSLPALAAKVDTTPCRTLYKQKKYAAAGDCFRRLSFSLKKKDEYVRKGRLMRNAASSYARAAAKTKKVAWRAYLYTFAARVLARYLKKKLAENDFRRRSALAQRKDFLKKVGFASLTVLVSNKTRVDIRGFRYKQSHVGRVNRRLRPGRYRVKVWFANGTKRLTWLTLQPSENKQLRLSAPPPRPVPVRPKPLPRTQPKVQPNTRTVPSAPIRPRPAPVVPRSPTPSPEQPLPRGWSDGWSTAATPDGLPPVNSDPKRELYTLTEPYQRKRIRRRPKPKANPQRKWLIIGSIAGGALVVMGALFAIGSQIEYTNAKNTHEMFRIDPSFGVKQTQQISKDLQQANIASAVGIPMLGAGGILGATCLIILLTQPTTTNPTNQTKNGKVR